MIDPVTINENAELISHLISENPMEKESARSNLNDYLVTYAQEDGLFRKVFKGPLKVSEGDLHPQFDFFGPAIVRDMLPGCNYAVSVPVGNVPVNTYFNMPRYRILFDRIQSRRFRADVARLRNYQSDVKKVFNDLMLKMVLYEEDRKCVAIADTILGFSTAEAAARGVDITTGGTGNKYNAAYKTRVTNVTAKGAIDLGGAIANTTINLLSKGLPSTTRNLEGRTVVINNVTVKDFMLFTHYTIGDLAQDLLTKGYANVSTPFGGMDWVVTIKKDLVPNNCAYVFTDPEFLGDFCILDDVAIYVKTESHNIEMWCEEMPGITFANDGALCKGYFGGTAGTW